MSWLLMHRVETDTAARHKGEKKIVDGRLRLMREFERIAYSNLGDVVSWDRKPVLGEDGTVQGFTDEIVATPSRKLGADKLAAVKSVTTKSGNLKLELHDKLTAMMGLAKVLGMTVDAAPVSNLTVNQVNIGESSSLETMRRLHFLLTTGLADAKLIEGEAVKTSDTSE